MNKDQALEFMLEMVEQALSYSKFCYGDDTPSIDVCEARACLLTAQEKIKQEMEARRKNND